MNVERDPKMYVIGEDEEADNEDESIPYGQTRGDLKEENKEEEEVAEPPKEEEIEAPKKEESPADAEEKV